MESNGICGDLMWELYQIQRRLRAFCDFVKELINFQEEYFIPHKQQENKWRRVRIAIAVERRSIRETGAQLRKSLRFQMAMAE